MHDERRGRLRRRARVWSSRSPPPSLPAMRRRATRTHSTRQRPCHAPLADSDGTSTENRDDSHRLRVCAVRRPGLASDVRRWSRVPLAGKRNSMRASPGIPTLASTRLARLFAQRVAMLTSFFSPVSLRPCQAFPQAKHPEQDARRCQGCRVRNRGSRVPDCRSPRAGRRTFSPSLLP